ncbi:FitA-like ribbon-helix-helix domain-containing protein [Kushneria phosphatilytica]|uniref:Plasmid stabilization protein n=1 Tax=Kushneria phosphatilytica TaxID=657387 RepID=A0A1S1NYD8_9GAMM|nr:plasmid stabilization protein [Kushneria phosphatilytica]QEL10641.1 plasmid stabilization protein [Kushneria phosphatilytica]
MASITIRNLDDKLKAQLRMEAARHGHSMEEEVRIILRSALNQPQAKGLGSRIRERFADAGGIELEVSPRSDKPRDPGFGA